MHQPGMSELPSPDILQELLVVFRISTDRDPSQLLKELLHVTFHKLIVQKGDVSRVCSELVARDSTDGDYLWTGPGPWNLECCGVLFMGQALCDVIADVRNGSLTNNSLRLSTASHHVESNQTRNTNFSDTSHSGHDSTRKCFVSEFHCLAISSATLCASMDEPNNPLLSILAFPVVGEWISWITVLLVEEVVLLLVSKKKSIGVNKHRQNSQTKIICPKVFEPREYQPICKCNELLLYTLSHDVTLLL
ncbi:hypothetical protein NC653_018534 [Populus alba x Populus x berolinensis]|uniref:Uncharacterized protein n=1 Tax=Populus alba x Populus x berolinensis TaxID=444605 RepID=A0AAD6QGQ4_9ROSI|nr:hypothetical protein NC653_018534 [Populus alba x Populus x berolinensis]